MATSIIAPGPSGGPGGAPAEARQRARMETNHPPQRHTRESRFRRQFPHTETTSLCANAGISRHFGRSPLRYTLETDRQVGAAGFEPVHQKLEPLNEKRGTGLTVRRSSSSRSRRSSRSAKRHGRSCEQYRGTARHRCSSGAFSGDHAHGARPNDRLGQWWFFPRRDRWVALRRSDKIISPFVNHFTHLEWGVRTILANGNFGRRNPPPAIMSVMGASAM
jgi:hypothetical protein